MPKRRNSGNTTAAHNNNKNAAATTPRRRSQRLLNQIPQGPNSHNSKHKNTHKGYAKYNAATTITKNTRSTAATPRRQSRKPLNHKPQDPNTHNSKSANNHKGCPKYNAAITITNNTHAAASAGIATPRRQSQRLLNQKTQDSNAHNPKPINNHKDYPKSSERFIICSISSTGSANFPTFSDRVNKVSSRRRSLRLSSQANTHKVDTKSNSSSTKFTGKNRVLFNEESCVEERRSDNSCIAGEVVVGLAAKARASDVRERNEEIIGVDNKRKRKRREETNEGIAQGWTKEQEMALQRAYFAAKPTPNFWKKVSKMVPGKSAQDCFDKIHSDHSTPPQALPRSRANKINSSPLESFSLSASKLLNPSGMKGKRSTYGKQKSHLAQKTVRALLQKHKRMEQDEADLFSILEPNMNQYIQHSQLHSVISIPEKSQEKQGFLHKCFERSSSGHKKPLSRFNRTDIVSPPVLKQVKNRALHEKYIDQLHCREAKRKAASTGAGKSITGKENKGKINVQKIDVVRAAKNALVCDARDAINQLKDLQANASNSSDIDYVGVNSDDEDGEYGF